MAYLLKSKIVDSPVVADLQIKSGLMTRLRDTLRLLLPAEGEMPNATKIRQQVESSGINYEARVRQVLQEPASALARKELASNLKGLLLEIYNSTEPTTSNNPQKSSGSFTDFRNTLKYAIDNIELNQLSSQISKQENQPVVIQIPNPLSSTNKTLQLFVRNDSSEEKDGNKKSPKKHNVAFFLDLSFLGKIKINAQMSPEQLSVSIDVENEDIASFIRHRAKDLEERMTENDIATSVECNVNQKVEPEKDNLVDLLISHNTSLINIKT
ncbi:MAG: flagellar hook-length control protein FliK [Nitrospina sp.]|nr:flagellar hook-length control protein FliK [Nitrospina sp.]MBT5633786.1 flagellar hook-length control protein FliK [Nitrospina sp.]